MIPDNKFNKGDKVFWNGEALTIERAYYSLNKYLKEGGEWLYKAEEGGEGTRYYENTLQR